MCVYMCLRREVRTARICLRDTKVGVLTVPFTGFFNSRTASRHGESGTLHGVHVATRPSKTGGELLRVQVGACGVGIHISKNLPPSGFGGGTLTYVRPRGVRPRLSSRRWSCPRSTARIVPAFSAASRRAAERTAIRSAAVKTPGGQHATISRQQARTSGGKPRGGCPIGPVTIGSPSRSARRCGFFLNEPFNSRTAVGVRGRGIVSSVDNVDVKI